jgi:hypothetical protein
MAQSQYKPVKGQGAGKPQWAKDFVKRQMDFSQGKNNTSDQKQEIQNAYSSQSSSSAPAYTPPAQKKDKPKERNKVSLQAESMVKDNMMKAWGGRTPGRMSTSAGMKMRDQQTRASTMVARERTRLKWGSY